ncbi:MAG: putative DNA binding domain-containing protein [Sandaracinaceae bacterium]|nr:putative DNA binding domain-containing protein [Sandaracinaceae bacterium]
MSGRFVESLTVELKSDTTRLSDRDLVEAIVCLANTEGGELYLGVEDNGTPTGVNSTRANLETMRAMIANRTSPPISVLVSVIEEDGQRVARISVPKSSSVVATTEGVTKKRRIGPNGKPECIALLPAEIPSRLSDLGVLDASAQPVPGATVDDLDPLERVRLREFIERYGGDTSLVGLDDGELDGALGFVARSGADRTPTLAGMLLIGREASLRRLVPTHEVAFQVLAEQDVRLNQFSRAPLLRVFEWFDTSFAPFNVEEEVQAGLFRVPVPRVDKRAFREAVANALAHRDYTRLGAVHVRLDDDALVVSNPGGFVEGVTRNNLLTTEPRPRNAALADALKRVGLVERTGRGVDLIYRGMLRYGRSQPDYSASNTTSVVLRMPAIGADLNFLRIVLEAENRRGAMLPIDSLIALACLRDQRRVTVDEVASAIQKDRTIAKSTLEALIESGLAAPHGKTSGRTYTLAPKLYAQLDKKTEYTRQVGFDAIQQEQMVLSFLKQNDVISRGEVTRLAQLSDDQATRLLKKMVDRGVLRTEGDRRWRRYRLAGGTS